jgi:hypothetical protein
MNMRSYYLELGGALLLYVVVLALALRLAPDVPSGALQTGLYVSPMIPLLLAIWAVVRQVRRSDEYIRQSTLEYIAIAAAVTVGWTITYGFLEIAGYPRLSMFTVWPVMGGVWAVLACLGSLRNR